MSNFVDDVDLVDDGAPMPGETKPTLKSNPSGRTLVPLTHKKVVNTEEIVQKSGAPVISPSGAIQIGKNKLGGTVFTIPKRDYNTTMEQQPEKGKRMNASSFMQQTYQPSYLKCYPKGIPRSFLVEKHEQNFGAPSTTSSSTENVLPILSAPAAGLIGDQNVRPMFSSGLVMADDDESIPRSFLTPEHQQQIGQTPKPLISIDMKSFQQNTKTQSQPKTPTNKAANDMSQRFQQFLQNQQNPQTANEIKPGFKRSFQPIEPQQQPKASPISINIMKTGSGDTSVNASEDKVSQNKTESIQPKRGKKFLKKQRRRLRLEMEKSMNNQIKAQSENSTDANKPLRKQPFREAKKILHWTKNDMEIQDGETPPLSDDTSANPTDDQGSQNSVDAGNKSNKGKKMSRYLKRKQANQMKWLMIKNFKKINVQRPTQTSTTPEATTTTSTITALPQQTTTIPQQQTTTIPPQPTTSIAQQIPQLQRTTRVWPQQTITHQQPIIQQQQQPIIQQQQQPIIQQQQPIIYQQQTEIQQQTVRQRQTLTPQQTMSSPKEGIEPRQVYSPSDIYNEATTNMESEEEESNDEMDESTPGSKRLSAFRRLGPVTQPKKPKMTINWLCNKDVRQVVETVEDEDVPVHLRKYIQMSTDDTVLRYLARWPWTNPPPVRRTVSARHSKSVMILEQEQMDDLYRKDNTFFQLSITGYPDTWNKENVLDTVMETVKGSSFIPCFIEFSKSECKFLVIRSRTALIHFHKLGFVIKKDDVTLHITISVINLSVSVLEFVPRLILMKRLTNALTDTELDLKAFTLQKDVSHFIYFPLERQTNQIELLKLQSTVQWELLTKLDLSFNKLTNLNGFFLKMSTPKLKHLILSHNLLDKIACLVNCRNLPLKSIALEGNPLCSDYIDKDHYVKVLKMLFTELVEIDGINIIKTTELPAVKQNYCTEEARPVIERVLEVFFPLLERSVGERLMIQNMYDDNAMLTITHMPRLRYSPIYLDFRSLFKYARILEEDELLCIKGASSIAKVLCKWPQMEHDPYTFTVDLMYHMDTTLIFRIGGIFKLTSDSLAEDEPILHFTRTLVLNTRDGVEYKISNEMVYWELPSKESVKAAFKSTSVWKRQLSLKLETPPDEELKENLLQIFMNLTHMDRNPSLKCLELKNWHLRNAMDYFVLLLKLDNLDPIMK